MVSRNLPVRSWSYYLYRWNRLLPFGKDHELPSSFTRSRDPEGLFQRINAGFKFTQEEEEIAKNWLLNKGMVEGEPFVCLLVRDSAFHEMDPLHGAGDKNSIKSTLEYYLLNSYMWYVHNNHPHRWMKCKEGIRRERC